MTLRACPLFARRLGHRAGAIAGLALAMLCGAAQASGDFGPPPSRFVAANGADVDSLRLEAGHVGVIQTGWPRLRLYAAWRAMALDAKGLPGPVLPAGTLDRILGLRPDATADCGGSDCVDAWRKAAQTVLVDAQRDSVTGTRLSPDYADYVECAPDAFATATRTLASLRARSDATPERLRAWVDAQDAVFSNCDLPTPIPESWQAGGFRKEMIDRQPTPRLPTLLPTSEVRAWREQRDYQLAAALFHSGRLDEAARAFQAIAANPGHAMHRWGGYLALRTALRQALLMHAKDADSPAAAQALVQLQQEGDAILADPSLEDLHEPTRATLRRARARLAPSAYFLALSRAIEDPSQSPTAEDRLADWRMLSFTLLDGFENTTPARFRTASPMLDWMATIQACATPPDLPITGAGRPGAATLLSAVGASPEDRQVAQSCQAASAHALETWRAALGANDVAGARPWLLACLMTTDTLPADVRAQALATRVQAPEFLTLQAQLARLARLADDFPAERAAAAAGLAVVADAPQDRQARNVFLRARFDTAADLASAVADLERPVSMRAYLASGETQAPPTDQRELDKDGETWLDTRLSAQDLLAVSASPRLTPQDRVHVAVAAWLRADFTGQASLAERAARASGDLQASLKPLAQRYVRAAAADRRHVLLVGVLAFKLYPDLHREWQPDVSSVPQMGAERVLAEEWCGIADTGVVAIDPTTSKASPFPDIEGRPLRGARPPALINAEVGQLRALPTATGMIGRDTLVWARQHPDDPDVPWLLYVTVRSTRGGCLDPDAHTLSIAAHRLLHTRYPKSVWTTRAPYYY